MRGFGFLEMHRRRSIRLFAVAAVTAAVAVPPALGGVAAAGPSGAGTPGGLASAQAQAVASGQPVLIGSSLTETDETYANPDGSMTLVTSADPVRVRQSTGWVPVDTTLVRAGDGSYAPRAATAAITLSGGGSGALASIREHGVGFALSWSGSLPAPTVSGDTATYAEVLPGVDLQVRAGAASFSEVLVVKSAAAARQSALRSLRFATAVSGGTVAADGAGGFVVRDALGGVSLSSPAPAMWDSSGLALGGPATTGNTARSAAGGPPDGSKVAALPDTLSSGAVTLAPSQSMLTDPSTVFPVIIDPQLGAKPGGRAMVNKTYPTTSYYNWGGTDEGDGYNDYAGVNLKRLYWQFGTSSLSGKHLLSATFAADETFSAECVASRIDMYLTRVIPSSMTWNSQPSGQVQESSASPKGVRPTSGSDCTDTPPVHVEWPALSAVKDSIANGWTTTTLALRAHDETADSGWHRFKPGATLTIIYNTPPTAPTSLHTTNPTTSCVTGSTRPIVGGLQPTLVAHQTDADGGNVAVDFEVDLNGSKVWGTRTSAKAEDSDFLAPMPSGLLHSGNTYSWHASGWDGTDEGPVSHSCEFTIDTTRPAAPTITSSQFPAEQSGSNAALGTSGTFTVTSSSTDVVSFRYGFDNDGTPSTVASSGATTTLAFTPKTFGPHTLDVVAVDGAGNLSDQATYRFDVNGTVVSGKWEFQELSGTTASDSQTSYPTSANPVTHPLTLGDGTTWDSGPRDQEPCPDGTPFQDGALLSYSSVGHGARTATTVVDTSGSFSVSAWVRIEDKSHNRIAVSEGGTTKNAFVLAYLAGSDAFSFSVSTADSTANVVTTSLAPGGVDTESWYHLVGVYSAADRDVALHVYNKTAVRTDDVPAKTASGAVFSATSPLAVADGSGGTSGVDTWIGDVDDVRVFPGTLAESEVTQLEQEPPPCPSTAP